MDSSPKADPETPEPERDRRTQLVASSRQVKALVSVGGMAIVLGVLHWTSLGHVSVSAWALELLPLAATALAVLLVVFAPGRGWIAAVLLGVALLPWGCGHLSVALIHRMTEPVRDVDQFAALRRTLAEHSSVFGHFPEAIPDGASEVSFYYLPHFMQGAGLMHLRFHASPEDIERYWEEATRKASATRSRLATDQELRDSAIWLEPTLVVGESQDAKPSRAESWYQPEHEGPDVPERFEVFYLNPPVPKDDWNHPNLWGIAIDREAGEVIFWAHDG